MDLCEIPCSKTSPETSSGAAAYSPTEARADRGDRKEDRKIYFIDFATETGCIIMVNYK